MSRGQGSSGPTEGGGVPHVATRFFGRRDVLARLEADLVDGGERLVTLLGPGGVGKTRVAVEFSHLAAGSFEDGVVWLDLLGLDASGLLVRALADAVGAESAGDEPDLGGVADVLGRRHALLVLDNCEHVVDEVVEVVATVVERCPAVRVLATSRERLAVPGEVVVDVLPLAGDEAGEHQPAVALFVDRARRVSGLDPTEEDLARIAEITRLVDGLPLGIELAAARTRTLGVAEIAAGLRERLSLLDEALRTRHERHRGLLPTLRWSHGLLAEPERELLERLAVCRGPFALDTAVAVGRPIEDAADDSAGDVADDVLVDRLQQLVDKSLVQAVPGPDWARRYALLDTVRRFGEDRLRERDALDGARRAHLAHHRDLLRRAAEGLRGADQLRWVAALESQRDDIRAAVQTGIELGEQGDAGALEATLDLLAHAFWFWGFVEGHGEGRRWGELALALDTGDVDPAVVAEAAWTTGGNCWLVGDRVAGLRWIEQAIDVAEQAGARRPLAGASMMRSRLQFFEGDVDDAMAHSRRSGELFDELGDDHRAALGRSVLGVCLAMRGDHAAAVDVLEEVVATFRSHGDDYFLALTLGDLGNVHYLAGDLEAAVEATSGALAAARRVGARWMESGQLTWLAELERHRGSPARAAELLEEVLALAENVSGVQRWRDVHLHLGLARAAEGEHVEAASLLAAALEDALAKQADATVAAALEALAGVAEALGDADAARRLAAASVPARARAGPPRTPATLADLRRVAHLLPDPEGAGTDPEGEAADPHDLLPLARGLGRTRPSPATSTASGVRVLGLGPVEVHRDGRLLTPADWTYAKPKAVLFFLLEAGPSTKDEIGLAIWPDGSATQLTRNLRTALYHLRNALDDREAVRFTGGRYAVALEGLWYDVTAFEEALTRAEALPAEAVHERVEALGEAVRLHRGDFLADLRDEAWAMARREELRRRWLAAAATRARQLEDLGETVAAAGAHREVLEHDPWSDGAHVGLLRCTAALGDRTGALEHFARMERAYAEDLGIEPPAAARDLVARLRRGD